MSVPVDTSGRHQLHFFSKDDKFKNYRIVNGPSNPLVLNRHIGSEVCASIPVYPVIQPMRRISHVQWFTFKPLLDMMPVRISTLPFIKVPTQDRTYKAKPDPRMGLEAVYEIDDPNQYPGSGGY